MSATEATMGAVYREARSPRDGRVLAEVEVTSPASLSGLVESQQEANARFEAEAAERNAAAAVGAQPVLYGLNKDLKSLMAMMKMDKLFKVVDTQADLAKLLGK